MENGVSLSQQAVDSKSNEITAVPELLTLLELEGAIVTYDAMGCQKDIAQAIRDAGADYVLAVKENQPRLCEDVVASFVEAFEGERGETYQQRVTHDQGHGRPERREYVVARDLSKIRDRDLWPDLRAVALVYSERTINGQTTEETRYYISSCRGTVSGETAGRFAATGESKTAYVVARCDLWRRCPLLAQDHGPENMAAALAAAAGLVKQKERSREGQPPPQALPRPAGIMPASKSC